MSNETKQQWLKKQESYFNQNPQETIEDVFIRLVESCEQYIISEGKSKASKAIFESAVICSRTLIEKLNIKGL